MFAILSALLGALVASWVAHILAVRRENARSREDRMRDLERDERERQREADRQHRELVGLLRLVHVEVVNNLELLENMGNQSGTYFRGKEKLKRGADALRAPQLSTNTWDQSRSRIAALLEDAERLKHMVGGYGALSAFKGRLLNPDTDSLSERDHKEEVEQIRRHQWLVFDACQKETGMFWAYSRGMLVSKPVEGLEEDLEEPEEEP